MYMKKKNWQKNVLFLQTPLLPPQVFQKREEQQNNPNMLIPHNYVSQLYNFCEKN